MNRNHSAIACLYLILAVTPINAYAQLALRLAPEVDDPGTSSMPARIGYGHSNKGSGAATQFALTYSVAKGAVAADLIYEPYVALVINDNSSLETDSKSIEVGIKSVYRDITQHTAWLIDGSAASSKDREAGTNSINIQLSVEPVAKWLRFGLGYTPGRWGIFIRPKVGTYYLHTIDTDDTTKSPTGTVTGLLFNLGVDLFPSFSDRTKISLAGSYAKDYSASGKRMKDDYKKGTVQFEYVFYNAAEPPKGKALFSLIVERTIGRDALSTSQEKQASTGIYIGAQY
jgi:hypothetical protein